ncbi:plastocyanin (plasmid) [Halogeometricum borinquense DSM 11551]|uniref:Plastocyanin n=2 Tax=Halogeometricum borinquense (strain ATCC 700274 / DSM 11551 / JCM 10706 / KCTC 4070 / PR3) TaxID=469382 RepID=E4NU89_HALBP|nr:plastocyanin [Halogeometricum borinquense DSM 11551]
MNREPNIRRIGNTSDIISPCVLWTRMGRTSNGVPRREFAGTVVGAAALSAATGTAAAQEGQQHTVEMTDGLVFEPDAITIAPGDTVVWENVGSIGHSVTAYEDDIPEGADYFASGGFDSEDAARSAYSAGDPESGDIAGGESYEHTFETEGTFEYFCIPHETVGMVGSVTVTPGGAAEENGGPAAPQVPDSAKTLAIATTIALTSVVGLTYFFLKYGGDYEIPTGDENQ